MTTITTQLTILPGEIIDRDWYGPRCTVCGKPAGGDNSDATFNDCSVNGQVHFTMDDLPKDLGEWLFDNARNELGSNLAALDWMIEGEPSPYDLIKSGDVYSVFETQCRLWPSVPNGFIKRRQAAQRFSAQIRAGAA